MREADEVPQRPGTKAERMITGGLSSFASKVGTRIASIVNSIIIVRTLGFYDLGVLSIVLLLVAVGNIAASFGVPQAIVKFIAGLPADDSWQAGRILGGGLALTLLATALTTAVVVAVSPLLASAVYGEPLVAVLLPLAVLSLVFSAALSPVFATIQAYERIRDLGIRDVIASILSVPTTVSLVLSLGLLGAVLASIVNSVLGIAVRVTLVRSIWRNYGLQIVLPRDRETYRKLINYAIPTMIGGLLVTHAQWLASTLLAIHGSFVALGHYAVGFALAAYLFFITDSIGLPFLPLVSRLNREKPIEVPAFLLRTLRIGTFLLLPPTLAVILFPEWILSLVFGPKGLEAAPIAGILASAIFFAGVAGIVGHAISGIGRMWDGLAINLVWGIGFVSLCFLLIPTWKEVGLAIALLCAYVVHYGLALFYASRRWSIPLAKFGPSSVVAAGTIALSFALGRYAPSPSGLFGAVALSAVVLIEFGVMSRREREVLTLPLRRFFGG